MTPHELSVALKTLRDFYDLPDSMYVNGMTDGVRELLERLGYKPPPLDQLSNPEATITRA